MTSEARLKELARMLANHPFLGMAVDEINSLEAENAELRKELAAVRYAHGRLVIENAELRERVGGLERALARLENWLEVTATYAVSKPKRDYAESTLKTLRDDLSPRAQAKLENQEEE